MNDIITPSGLDLTKNLHGHVRVETRSRWTGKVIDSQEKDNLVTNAIQRLLAAYVFQYSAQINPPFGVFHSPFYAKALGGLVLFGATLTESASNIWIPSNAKIVGLAGQSSNSTSDIIGSWNQQESVLTSNGYTTVWDFLTSQANGTIASLGRTSYQFPFFPAYYKADNSAPSMKLNNMGSDGIEPYLLGYDEANEYLYFGGNNNTVNGVTYSSSNIYKIKFSFDSVNLFGGFNPGQATLIKTLTSSDGNQYSYNWIYDQYANNFVYLSSNTLHIVAMDGTHTTKTLSNTGSGSIFTVTENYYWRGGSGTLYRITKANVADITSYAVSGLNYITPAENDIVIVNNSASSWRFVYPDGTILVLGGGTTTGTFNNSAKAVGPFATYSNNNYYRTHYLGTIANLDSPVTKTSSQTMKITYTLTES